MGVFILDLYSHFLRGPVLEQPDSTGKYSLAGLCAPVSCVNRLIEVVRETTTIKSTVVLHEGLSYETSPWLPLLTVAVKSEDTLGLQRPVAPCAGAVTALLAVGIIVLGVVLTLAVSILIDLHKGRTAWVGLDVDVPKANGFIG